MIDFEKIENTTGVCHLNLHVFNSTLSAPSFGVILRGRVENVDYSYHMMLIVGVRHSGQPISKAYVKVKETIPFSTSK